jgi:hypothetical protein
LLASAAAQQHPSMAAPIAVIASRASKTRCFHLLHCNPWQGRGLPCLQVVPFSPS